MKLIEKIFSRDHGWNFSPEEIAVTQEEAGDGNPNFIITFGEIEVIVAEQLKARSEEMSDTQPGRIIIRAFLPEFSILKPDEILALNHYTDGLPTIGVDEEGEIKIATAIPAQEEFPVEVMRKQIIVCATLVANRAGELIQLWSDDNGKKKKSRWKKASEAADTTQKLLEAIWD